MLRDVGFLLLLVGTLGSIKLSTNAIVLQASEWSFCDSQSSTLTNAVSNYLSLPATTSQTQQCSSRTIAQPSTSKPSSLRVSSPKPASRCLPSQSLSNFADGNSFCRAICGEASWCNCEAGQRAICRGSSACEDGGCSCARFCETLQSTETEERLYQFDLSIANSGSAKKVQERLFRDPLELKAMLSDRLIAKAAPRRLKVERIDIVLLDVAEDGLNPERFVACESHNRILLTPPDARFLDLGWLMPRFEESVTNYFSQKGIDAKIGLSLSDQVQTDEGIVVTCQISVFSESLGGFAASFLKEFMQPFSDVREALTDRSELTEHLSQALGRGGSVRYAPDNIPSVLRFQYSVEADSGSTHHGQSEPKADGLGKGWIVAIILGCIFLTFLCVMACFVFVSKWRSQARKGEDSIPRGKSQRTKFDVTPPSTMTMSFSCDLSSAASLEDGTEAFSVVPISVAPSTSNDDGSSSRRNRSASTLTIPIKSRRYEVALPLPTTTTSL